MSGTLRAGSRLVETSTACRMWREQSTRLLDAYSQDFGAVLEKLERDLRLPNGASAFDVSGEAQKVDLAAVSCLTADRVMQESVVVLL